jgi:hypothetical protein
MGSFSKLFPVFALHSFLKPRAALELHQLAQLDPYGQWKPNAHGLGFFGLHVCIIAQSVTHARNIFLRNGLAMCDTRMYISVHPGNPAANGETA